MLLLLLSLSLSLWNRLSAVGNRVSVFDLVQNTSFTLPFENNKDIARLALSPNGVILLSVDVDGRALLMNLPRKARHSRGALPYFLSCANTLHF